MQNRCLSRKLRRWVVKNFVKNWSYPTSFKVLSAFSATSFLRHKIWKNLSSIRWCRIGTRDLLIVSLLQLPLDQAPNLLIKYFSSNVRTVKAQGQPSPSFYHQKVGWVIEAASSNIEAASTNIEAASTNIEAEATLQIECCILLSIFDGWRCKIKQILLTDARGAMLQNFFTRFPIKKLWLAIRPLLIYQVVNCCYQYVWIKCNKFSFLSLLYISSARSYDLLRTSCLLGTIKNGVSEGRPPLLSGFVCTQAHHLRFFHSQYWTIIVIVLRKGRK